MLFDGKSDSNMWYLSLDPRAKSRGRLGLASCEVKACQQQYQVRIVKDACCCSFCCCRFTRRELSIQTPLAYGMQR